MFEYLSPGAAYSIVFSWVDFIDVLCEPSQDNYAILMLHVSPKI